MSFTSTQEAIQQAQSQLTSLRHLLDLLRAQNEASELAGVVRETRGELTLLQESLADASAAETGKRLFWAAHEKELKGGPLDPDDVFSLEELYVAQGSDSFALHRDFRIIGQAWEKATSVESFAALTEQLGLETTCGLHAAEVLQHYYHDILQTS
ncbi:hypothetical protein [Stutzerimonas nitrititolerans]|uniref:hypothetical protein n=1 Tax=Stutzerimonas nitrititolerans TaxID=2482751 RepID=UPI0028B262B0|nr:hypothetical protein [Stutzerimonas nitrititolerans]